MTITQRFRPVRARAAALAAAAALLVLAPAGHAQFGEAAGIAESMQPEFLSRDLVLFNDGLQLDDSQRVILEALFDDYQDAFDTGFAQMRQKFEDMRPQLVPGDEDRIMRMVFAPFEEWIVEKAALGDQFRANVKAVLNEEQLAMWPAFERRMRREKTLHKGRLSGESLNLFHVLRDMDLHIDITRQIQSTVDEYDIALDDALRRREETLRTMQPEVLGALQEQDGAKSLDIVNRQLALSIAIRDVNDRYIEIIAAALPSPEAETFHHNALQKAYPRVYRRSPVEKMFQAALELEDMPDESRETIAGLLETYQVELAVVNTDLVNLIKDDEPEKQRYRAKAFAARLNGSTLSKPEDRTRPAFQRKEELGSFYVNALRDMVTPEQFAALPGGSRWIEKELRKQRADANRNQTRERSTGLKHRGDIIAEERGGRVKGGNRGTDENGDDSDS